ncbi:MAG: threonine ammonia-lyase [Firmicutes bacterium]|nr:threonine ammonia-lyase [Bacillota bacterium]
MELKLEDIEKAAIRLEEVIHETPLERSNTFSKMSKSDLYLKYENQQKTGSFKIRGAYNKIATLMETEKPKAVIASSAGNHAQGVAFAASTLGMKATIVMPRSTPIAKIAATEEYGAEVVLHGNCYDEAYAKANEISKQTGAVFIHPFNDVDVMAGQATIGLEILRSLPTVDVVCVPAGGGGILAGVACCLKSINPRIKVIGVQAEGAPAICNSFKDKKLCFTDYVQTIADGIAVKEPGNLTVELINKYVDEIVTVSDNEIASTILLLLERTKQVVEPAGAVTLAAAINRKFDIKGKKVACILSGGNIDVSFIHKIIERGLIARGRQMKFKTVMPDIPGSLERFSRILAQEDANIVLFQHDRLNADLEINEAIIHVACELLSKEHGKRLMTRLKKEGYKVMTD